MYIWKLRKEGYKHVSCTLLPIKRYVLHLLKNASYIVTIYLYIVGFPLEGHQLAENLQKYIMIIQYPQLKKTKRKYKVHKTVVLQTHNQFILFSVEENSSQISFIISFF